MYVTKKRLIYLLITIVVFISFISAQEQEKLVEEVDVVNVMVPVRVFYKGEPVKGLKKDDFKIYVMGNETPIHGFSDYKARYANLKKTQSLEMANYLEKQDIKTWVIYFHQVGMFPQLKPAYDGRGGDLPQIFEKMNNEITLNLLNIWTERLERALKYDFPFIKKLYELSQVSSDWKTEKYNKEDYLVHKEIKKENH